MKIKEFERSEYVGDNGIFPYMNIQYWLINGKEYKKSEYTKEEAFQEYWKEFHINSTLSNLLDRIYKGENFIINTWIFDGNTYSDSIIYVKPNPRCIFWDDTLYEEPPKEGFYYEECDINRIWRRPISKQVALSYIIQARMQEICN